MIVGMKSGRNLDKGPKTGKDGGKKGVTSSGQKGEGLPAEEKNRQVFQD